MNKPAPRDKARAGAWQLLEQWYSGQHEHVIVERDLPADPRDAALTRELALGVVRWQRLYDALCLPFLRPGDQPRQLSIALRLLCHQFFALDRIPQHAALHATVETAKECGAAHFSGVINAVGRKLTGIASPERHGDGPLGRILPERWPTSAALRYSLPDLLVNDLTPVFPGDRDQALAALNHVPPLCTRLRSGVSEVVGKSIIKRDGEWAWWDDPHEALTGPVADGRCVVQDKAQGEIIAAALPRPGDRVLDVCAAPGGKSLAFADRGCWVVAADSSRKRFTTLKQNLSGQAALLAQDGLFPALAKGSFDIVVVDAPCSNTGVLGRRPEARWRYDQKNLASLGVLQRGLLNAAAPLVNEGGKLVYSTCSLSPRENQQIAQSLDGWRILVERLSWPDAWQAGGYVATLIRKA